MKRLFFFVFSLLVLSVQAQQYTQLCFEDKNGLKDTLTIAIGLSDDQTAALPEYSLAQAELAMKDSTHWVWLMDYGQDQESGYYNFFCRTYNYKPYNGFIEYGKKYLYFPYDRLPVTITWDKQFFVTNEVAGSVLADFGSWFDVGAAGMEIGYMLLSANDSVTLHDTYEEGQTPVEDLTNGPAPYSCYANFGTVFVRQLAVSVGTATNLAEAIEDVQADNLQYTKVLRNGHLFILRGDRAYTLQGQGVK